MNLDTYLEQGGKGAAALLAKQIGAVPVLVSQWRKGARQVPAERCPDIERATGGAVRCEEMRPDVDWAFLRNPEGVARSAPGDRRAKGNDRRQAVEGSEADEL